MLALYGHPFSSYTWKVKIALYANDLTFDFRILDADHPDHGAVVAAASPQGKFPLLDDDGALVFEASSIIEHLVLHHPGRHALIPADPAAALPLRTLDRVFDNYVMAPMQAIVAEHLAAPGAPDRSRIAAAESALDRSYNWLETWLGEAPRGAGITLVECAAAPALFYADWVAPIGAEHPRLRAWRAELLALAPVARCVDEARPWRAFFPPGAPDRD